VIGLITLIFNMALASTHPLTGSSIINQPGNGAALSQMGFELNSLPSGWAYNKPLDPHAKSIELGADGKTFLSFRLENVSVKTQLERYVRKYLRDYNQYGFEITGLQSLTKTSVPSVIVDLKQKNNLNRSRQVFFYQHEKMIIATCTDESEHFEKTFAICNQILGTFKWH